MEVVQISLSLLQIRHIPSVSSPTAAIRGIPVLGLYDLSAVSRADIWYQGPPQTNETVCNLVQFAGLIRDLVCNDLVSMQDKPKNVHKSMSTQSVLASFMSGISSIQLPAGFAGQTSQN